MVRRAYGLLPLFLCAAAFPSALLLRALFSRHLRPLLARFRQPDGDRLLAALHLAALSAFPALQRAFLFPAHRARDALPGRLSVLSSARFLACTRLLSRCHDRLRERNVARERFKSRSSELMSSRWRRAARR